eukprot:1144528-Alexandrium_andersonii.AAC.1
MLAEKREESAQCDKATAAPPRAAEAPGGHAPCRCRQPRSAVQPAPTCRPRRSPISDEAATTRPRRRS